MIQLKGTALTEDTSPWLLLIHQLPPHPAYFRVKVWRQLQGLGAVALKNSVYVLPVSEGSREDFQWMVRQIAAGGGEASVVEAQFVDGLTDWRVGKSIFTRDSHARKRVAATGKPGAMAMPSRSRLERRWVKTMVFTRPTRWDSQAAP